MNKRCSIYTLLLILILSVVVHVNAQLTVLSLKPYQVIPRTSETIADYALSGTCKSGTPQISVTLTNQNNGAVVNPFLKKNISATIQGTSWSAVLKDLPVGGEYTAHFYAAHLNDSGEDSVNVAHLLVGDIWLCAGQSNFLQDAPDNPDRAHVHVRTLFRELGSSSGQVIDTSKWAFGDSAGPSISFGAELYKQTGIPVGIILAAVGNTSIDTWFAPPQRQLFTKTSTLVKAICNFKIRGFIWYQGENEDQQDTWALSYLTKFIPLRDTIRVLAQNPRLPVLVVQLESWDGGGKYALPVERHPRWPVIRDRQEMIGASDSFCVTVPAWDFAGLHIDSVSQGALGVRAAKIAAGNFFGIKIGTGPLFHSAWFSDNSRTKIIVRLTNLNGKMVLPDDQGHLGFYVMKPVAFDINDQAIFNYGASAKMLLPLKSVSLLDSDKVVIELNAAVSDSLTVGYGCHINLITLHPATDNSGIPLCTFFNRTIAKTPPVLVDNVHRTIRTAGPSIAILSPGRGQLGNTVVRCNLSIKGHVSLALFSIDGKKAVTLYDGFWDAGEHVQKIGLIAGRRPAGMVYICRFTTDQSVSQCMVPALK